jgi:hypothetical protein
MTGESIDSKLTKLANQMVTMSENDMGDLQFAEASLFHIACDAIERLLESRNIKLED